MNLPTRRATTPTTDTAARLQGLVMNEVARKHAEHDLRTAEAIVDFFFDLFEHSAAKLRGLASGTRH